MSASKKPPNSASKLRPSLLGGGSSSKGEKTPSRSLMQRMPWGARTPKRSTAESAADFMGVERRCASHCLFCCYHAVLPECHACLKHSPIDRPPS